MESSGCVISVVLQALWSLGRTAIKTTFLGIVAVFALVLSVLGLHPLLLLLLHRGWLTDAQLVDAVAVGQVTPGPVFKTATFGFILGGIRGAVIVHRGHLPSCISTRSGKRPLMPRIRKSKLAGAFLDGVNVASLALMAAVTWELGRASLVDTLTVLVSTN